MIVEQGVVELGPPTSTDTTPSGIEIEYWSDKDAEGNKQKRMYRVNGVEVPSVSTILEVLDKPALPWWGMGVGVDGALELIRQGKIHLVANPDGSGGLLPAVFDGSAYYHATKDNVIPLLTAAKLTTNHVKDEAGKRGTSAHSALEAYCALGTIPNPDDYPEVEKPYIVSLVRFLNDIHGSFEPQGMEIMVGSAEHGFAGRYDLRGIFTKDTRLVARAMTLKGEPLKRERDWKFVTVPGGTKVLLDAKTSKGVYTTHLMQLEGYEGAGIEGGYEPTDARAVIHLTGHGLYQFKRARARYEDFLAIKQAWHALRAVEEALKT